jgi:hypothetical protein
LHLRSSPWHPWPELFSSSLSPQSPIGLHQFCSSLPPPVVSCCQWPLWGYSELSTKGLRQADIHKLSTVGCKHKNGLGVCLRTWELHECHVPGHRGLQCPSPPAMPYSTTAVGYRWSRELCLHSCLVVTGKEWKLYFDHDNSPFFIKTLVRLLWVLSLIQY